MSPTKPQTMKPVTAAKKLGIHLPAAPESFRESTVTRADLARLMTSPPEWLQELRRNGPHPREVVAARLGISIAGLARGGVTEALTTEQIDELRDENPDWLVHERSTQAAVRAEEDRLAFLAARKEKRAKAAAPKATAPDA